MPLSYDSIDSFPSCSYFTSRRARTLSDRLLGRRQEVSGAVDGAQRRFSQLPVRSESCCAPITTSTLPSSTRSSPRQRRARRGQLVGPLQRLPRRAIQRRVARHAVALTLRIAPSLRPVRRHSRVRRAELSLAQTAVVLRVLHAEVAGGRPPIPTRVATHRAAPSFLLRLAGHRLEHARRALLRGRGRRRRRRRRLHARGRSAGSAAGSAAGDDRVPSAPSSTPFGFERGVRGDPRGDGGGHRVRERPAPV